MHKKELDDENEILPAEKMEAAKFSAVLSNIGFLLLWIGQLLSQLADRIFIYVLMILAYNLTKSNLGVAVPMLSFGIPSLLFGSFAGVFSDKLDRKGIMVVSDILRGALILLLIPVVSKSMVLIFVISFFIYTIAQFFAPAEASSIPDLVEKKDLIVANSLFMVTWIGAAILGIGLGAPLTTLVGESGTFVVAATLYLISAGAVFLIPLPQNSPAGTRSEAGFIKDFLFGLELIRRNFIISYSLLKMFVATSAISIVSLLAISYAKDVLGIGARNFGYLIISLGLGMLIGMPVLGKLSSHINKGMLTIIGFILSGATIIAIAGTSDLKTALALSLLLGFCTVFVISTIQTILQQRIPRGIRGRVFGFQNMLINSAFVFPVIIWGLIADDFGTPFALSLLGWILLGMGLVGFLVPKFKHT